MDNEIEIVVTGTDRTGSTFSRIRDKIKTTLRDTEQDADNGGKNIASRLIGTISSVVSSGVGSIKESFSSVFQGGLKGALSSGPIGAVILAGLAAAVAAVAAPIGALIAGALVLGFGAAFLGLGAVILLQNEKIKEQVFKSWAPIKETLTRAFEPLVPILQFLGKTLSGVAKQFEPIIKQAIQLSSGPLKGFIKELGKAFLELKPAIAPMMEAFSAIIKSLGPMLRDVFKDIAQSLIGLAKSVVENREFIAGMFKLLLQLIPRVIDIIRILTDVFGAMIRFIQGQIPRAVSAFNTMRGAFNSVVNFAKTAVDGVKRWFNDMVSFVTGLPGRIAGAVSNMFSGVTNAASNAAARVRSIFSGIGNLIPKFASGGIRGAASGGPRGNLTLVGEDGPELVRLPFGSHVSPSANTSAMMARGSGEAVVVNLYVQGSIRSDRDLVRIIRDEFVNGGFRGALNNV